METETLSSVERAGRRGQALVLYSDLGLQMQQLVYSTPRLYKLRDAAEEVFTTLYMCSLGTFPS